ncbi:MAG: MoxR family ATPase [Clostridiales bacterium]|nr:MoxR family ATPase [Clostridiales bacterium]
MSDIPRLVQEIKQNVQKVIVGKDDVIELMLIALLCEGHVLIEDVPGVGKTSLASALARSVGCSYRRIQFTPDVLPSDITGFSAPDLKTGAFEYRPGMVMSQIVLADEINRTSPKTQSSLLEAMEERQVTVDGVTRPVPRPFLVLATQNPVEYIGTYPLPEAQLDRFLMRVSIGYPSLSQQIDILTRYAHDDPRETLTPVTSADEIARLITRTRAVHCAPPIKEYIASLTARTRLHEHVSLGVSPRGALYLMRAAQGSAFIAGRDYVIPDDVQKVCVPVLSHRLMVRPEARIRDMTAERVVQSVMAMTDVPASYR